MTDPSQKPLSFSNQLIWWYLGAVERQQFKKADTIRKVIAAKGSNDFLLNKLETCQPEGRGFRVQSKILEDIRQTYKRDIDDLISLDILEVMNGGSYMPGRKAKAYALKSRIENPPLPKDQRESRALERCWDWLAHRKFLPGIGGEVLQEMGLPTKTKPMLCGRVNHALTVMERGKRNELIAKHGYVEVDVSACYFKILASFASDPDEKDRLVKLVSAEDPYQALADHLIGDDPKIRAKVESEVAQFTKNHPGKELRHYTKYYFNMWVSGSISPYIMQVFKRKFSSLNKSLECYRSKAGGSGVYRMLTRRESMVMNWVVGHYKVLYDKNIIRIHDAVVFKPGKCQPSDVKELIETGFEHLLNGEFNKYGQVAMGAQLDTQRLDWLERNLLTLSHNRASSSVDMGGINVHGRLVNEARGSNAGPSSFRVHHGSIRHAIDDAMIVRAEGPTAQR